jgi:hypothetical protein
MSYSAGFNDYKRMAEAVATKVQLDEVARLGKLEGQLAAVGALTAVIHKELIEIFNARPGRAAGLKRVIIPTGVKGVVHDGGAGVKTLGGEVGAIAAEGGKIVVEGVSGKRPFVRVGYCSGAVIGHGDHGLGLLFVLKIKYEWPYNHNIKNFGNCFAIPAGPFPGKFFLR